MTYIMVVLEFTTGFTSTSKEGGCKGTIEILGLNGPERLSWDTVHPPPTHVFRYRDGKDPANLLEKSMEFLNSLDNQFGYKISTSASSMFAYSSFIHYNYNWTLCKNEK